ncbi:threonine synthase [Treponema primitia]|uniref:threonine synthase n=1 Tax=Treponema primitia TaxID=88058 RepID=UPI000319BC50|nr:threonine synthase [Treponema primitia]
MQFRSTRSNDPLVSFKDAILQCLPMDGGLYVPASVLDMRQYVLYMDTETSYPELVATVAPALLQGELNPLSAARVAESAFDFEPELKQLDDNFSVLTLCNGPTGVFKDYGIAFLAAVMEELLKNDQRAMILSAARQDTGVSIAHAFSQRKGMISVILYPSGPVRGLDPKSYITNGGNVIPIQIKGTFDDCQRLILEAINDRPFAERYGITCANAINPGRLLPQVFYYFYAFIKLKKILKGELIFSVPTGNFGNLIAGLYAWKMGMPVNGFIAAMNANNAFGDYIKGKDFKPGKLIQTNSPALDVSVPSNYERLASFYKEAPAVMRNMVFPDAIDDRTTLAAMEKAWKDYHILLDPHGAVAFAAARRLSQTAGFNGHVVVLATGHPAKHADLVLQATGQQLDIPEKFSNLWKKTDPMATISPQLDALEGAIASCC